jgi:hypothetical protein
MPSGQSPAPPPPKKQSDVAKPAQTAFEILVQYREGVKESDKVAARKSVDAKLKETLGTPSDSRNLEVLIVPRTKKVDTIDQAVSELRRNKAVRIAEPQQVFSKQ